MEKIFAEAGDTLIFAIEKAKETIGPSKNYLVLDFNGIEIAVHKDSNPIDLITIYNLKYNIQNNIK